jgi:two-component system, LytTR family, response regulator
MIVAAPPTLPLSPGTPESEAQPAQPPAEKIRALIVDDQLLEREVLSRMLKSESDIEIIGTCTNGREALEAIPRLKPDLVFLDVQMPELDGFGVVTELNPSHMPVVIFITANEEFARRAFDVHALDYLIKPCERSRLRLALQRARQEIQRQQTGGSSQKISEPSLNDAKGSARFPERLAFKTGDRILFLRVAEIHWLEAVGDNVRLHAGEEVHLLNEMLDAVEARLPADGFLRISRSTIVNLEQIRELHPLLQGEYLVLLQNGTRLVLSEDYREKLRHLGL